MMSYQYSASKFNHIFKTNSFDPPNEPTEGNIWGAKFGIGTFESIWKMIVKGIRYAGMPTERYVSNSTTEETKKFSQPIGSNSEIYQGDMRKITADAEYDAVITDPPYYDNIIYSEVSDFSYVWQRILLKDIYPGFGQEKTPRAESIVTNPYLDKIAKDFGHEMGEVLEVVNGAIKDSGTSAFNYHHSDK